MASRRQVSPPSSPPSPRSPSRPRIESFHSWDVFVTRCKALSIYCSCWERIAKGIVYKVIAAWPSCFVFLILILFGTTIFFGLERQPPDVETDLEAMLKADVNSSLYHDAFMSAKAAHGIGKQQLQSDVYRIFDLVLGYENRTGASGALGFETIYGIRSIERRIRELSRFATLCESSRADRQGFCNPGISIANYMMPVQILDGSDVVPSTLTLNGAGIDAVPVSAALRLASMHGIAEVMLPIGMSPNSSTKADFLRSVFRFHLHVGQASDSASVKKTNEDKLVADWKDLIRDVLKVVSDESDVDVYLTGDFVEHLEVMDKLKTDLLFASGSFGFLLICVAIFTRSMILSVGGVVLIAMSTALSYALFALVGTKVLSVSCFLTVFFMPGLASDALFVYAEAWSQSSKACVEKMKASEQVGDRLWWTYRHGGKDSLVSSLIMAASCFACLVSVLRPLRDFGMFFGSAVAIIWVLASLVFVPLCAAKERCSNCSVVPQCFAVPWRRWLELYTRALNTSRLPCICVFFIALVAFCIVTLLSFHTDMAATNLFPKDHNQNRGGDVLVDNFQPLMDIADFGSFVPPISVDVCTAAEYPSSNTSCSLFWCDVETIRPLSQQFPTDLNCKCDRKQLPNTCGSQNATIKYRFAGLGQINTSRLRDSIADRVTNVAWSFGLPSSMDAFNSASLSPLLQFEWESGVGELLSWTEATATLAQGPGNAACGWDEVCFCGSSICKMPSSFSEENSIAIPMSVRRLDNLEARELQQETWDVPESNRVKVMLVLGLHVEEDLPLLGVRDSENLWSYLHNFAASNLQAQRDLKKLCAEVPVNLRIVAKNCWIERFESWLVARGQKFPAIPVNFPGLIQEFVAASPHAEAPFLWVVDGSLRAAYFEFTVDVDKKSEPWKLRDYMSLWDEYVHYWNAQVASPYVRGAWHTSDAWTRIESHVKMMNSMAWTLALICGCVFFIVLVATTDLVLSFYALLSAGWIIWSLLFSLIVIVGWDFGPIQVLIVNIFTGYAFISAVHIVQKFRDVSIDDSDAKTERYERVLQALTSIGCATMGSCLSASVSGIFMLPCALRIFSDVGVALLFVPILSALVAMVPLAALLLWLGPIRPGTSLGFHCVSTWKFACFGSTGRRSPPGSPKGEFPMDSLETAGDLTLASIPEHSDDESPPRSPSKIPTPNSKASRSGTTNDHSYPFQSVGSSSNSSTQLVQAGSIANAGDIGLTGVLSTEAATNFPPVGIVSTEAATNPNPLGSESQIAQSTSAGLQGQSVDPEPLHVSL